MTLAWRPLEHRVTQPYEIARRMENPVADHTTGFSILENDDYFNTCFPRMLQFEGMWNKLLLEYIKSYGIGPFTPLTPR